MDIRVIEELPDLKGCAERALTFAMQNGEEVEYNVLSFCVFHCGHKYTFSPWGDTVVEVFRRDASKDVPCWGR